jgi:PqqD family protein of HPr-rel-A system
MTGDRAVIYDPESGGATVLNPTGSFLWARLEDGASKDDLVEALINRFQLERSRAETDVDKFLASLSEAKLIGASPAA